MNVYSQNSRWTAVIGISMLFILLFAFAGCAEAGVDGTGGGDDPDDPPIADPLNLSRYYDAVVAALPGAGVGASVTQAPNPVPFDTLDGPQDALRNILLSEDAGAVVSIPYGIAELDAIIADINASVTEDNESADAGVIVTPTTSVTLPFFGDTVTVEYEVDLGGGKKGAYLISDTEETVVIYNEYEILWESPDPDINVTDHYIFYAHRAGAGTISIRFALYSTAVSDGSYAKDWAAEIDVDNTAETFAARSVWGSIESSDDEFIVGSLAVAGSQTGVFGYRYLDVASLYEYRYLVNAVDIAEHDTWDSSVFGALSVPALMGIALGSEAGDEEDVYYATIAFGTTRPYGDNAFTTGW